MKKILRYFKCCNAVNEESFEKQRSPTQKEVTVAVENQKAQQDIQEEIVEAEIVQEEVKMNQEENEDKDNSADSIGSPVFGKANRKPSVQEEFRYSFIEFNQQVRQRRAKKEFTFKNNVNMVMPGNIHGYDDRQKEKLEKINQQHKKEKQELDQKEKQQKYEEQLIEDSNIVIKIKKKVTPNEPTRNEESKPKSENKQKTNSKKKKKRRDKDNKQSI